MQLFCVLSMCYFIPAVKSINYWILFQLERTMERSEESGTFHGTLETFEVVFGTRAE